MKNEAFEAFVQLLLPEKVEFTTGVPQPLDFAAGKESRWLHPYREGRQRRKKEIENGCGADIISSHSDQMWTSSERFYPNVDKFGTFLPKCGQDGSGYSKPLPLLFPVVVGNIAGDAPPPLILRLFLSFRLHEFEREIGGGSRARAGLRPKKKGRLVTHRRFPSQTHAAASSETAAVSKVAARLRRCSHPLPEKEEVAVSNIQSRLVHIWVKTFRTCSHLGKNVPNLSTFGPSHLLKPSREMESTGDGQSCSSADGMLDISGRSCSSLNGRYETRSRRSTMADRKKRMVSTPAAEATETTISSDEKSVEDIGMTNTRSMSRSQNHDDASSSTKMLKIFDKGGVAPWLDVDHDVLFLIMMKLGFIDFFAFSGVCKSWRSFALTHAAKFMASKPPMSVCIEPRVYNHDIYSYCYLNDFQGRRFETILPHFTGRACIGVTCGYLILFGRKTRDFWLVHPITRHELHFPSCPLYLAASREIFRGILVFLPSISGWRLTREKAMKSKEVGRLWRGGRGDSSKNGGKAAIR
ncbi:hypothetical protein LXL04_027969 [Taraxacum kok-saghyz]